jgi:hypothetical protein
MNESAYVYCGSKEDDCAVADVFAPTGSRWTVNANAHLVAAAPDLLGACRTILWCLEAGYMSTQDGVVYDAQSQLAFEAIRAAIAKAEGGGG